MILGSSRFIGITAVHPLLAGTKQKTEDTIEASLLSLWISIFITEKKARESRDSTRKMRETVPQFEGFKTKF